MHYITYKVFTFKTLELYMYYSVSLVYP